MIMKVQKRSQPIIGCDLSLFQSVGLVGGKHFLVEHLLGEEAGEGHGLFLAFSFSIRAVTSSYWARMEASIFS